MRSALPKSGGSFSLVVSAMTRGPVKVSRAPGSATQMSASEAKLATTPPVQGSAMTATNGARASFRRSTAQLVLAICMSEMAPSCMRAPPELATQTSGRCSAAAASQARHSLSPTTLPMLPPRKLKSMTARMQGTSPIADAPATMASVNPLSACASRTRSV